MSGSDQKLFALKPAFAHGHEQHRRERESAHAGGASPPAGRPVADMWRCLLTDVSL